MLPSYRFPFQVTVGIDDQIGGPSAGLMFALGIYDTLTPGSLTDGDVIAGTGTIAPNGKVGRDRRDPAEDRGRPRDRSGALPGAGRQLSRGAGRDERRHEVGARVDDA